MMPRNSDLKYVSNTSKPCKVSHEAWDNTFDHSFHDWQEGTVWKEERNFSEQVGQWIKTTSYQTEWTWKGASHENQQAPHAPEPAASYENQQASHAPEPAASPLDAQAASPLDAPAGTTCTMPEEKDTTAAPDPPAQQTAPAAPAPPAQQQKTDSLTLAWPKVADFFVAILLLWPQVEGLLPAILRSTSLSKGYLACLVPTSFNLFVLVGSLLMC